MQNTFRIGQLVRLKQHGSSQGSGHPYCVVGILRSQAEDEPAYRIKNMTGVEQIVKPQDIKAASVRSVP